MWMYRDAIFTEDQIDSSIGFVYMISNKLDGRRYIGKKLFFFSKTRTIKGKKKREKAPSDWKKYWSSSVELQEDVLRLGEENFTREILYLCKSKGEMSYVELYLQVMNNVLLNQTRWYNGFVGGKIHRNHVKNLSSDSINNLQQSTLGV